MDHFRLCKPVYWGGWRLVWDAASTVIWWSRIYSWHVANGCYVQFMAIFCVFWCASWIGIQHIHGTPDIWSNFVV